MARIPKLVSYIFFVSFVVINNKVQSKDPELYTINTERCKIPAFPLVSDDILELVAPPADLTPNCSQTVALLASNSTHIWVDRQSFDYFRIIDESALSCCYKNFSAKNMVENISYGVCQEFSTVIKAKHEFVRVECANSGTRIYNDLFKFNIFHVKPKKQRDKKYFNVLLLGIDGMSRKNFLRTMSKTSNFLKYRGSVQLHGYNKLGDNSLPNLLPMLTGMKYKEAMDVCWKRNVYHEECTLMWNRYKSAGYYTALGADSGAGTLGTYESMLPYPPTDFYLQPFMYETRFTFKDKTYDYHMCLKNRYMFRELLKYAEGVTTHVRNNKLFGLFWEESVSHSHLNYPYIMDEDYLSLLTKLEASKYLQKTIVILFSDHGTRWGEMLATEQGRQESRLPLFEILLPPRFHSMYTTASRNLQLNSHQLTTAHDVYETLLDLIDTSSLSNKRMKERQQKMNPNSDAISLFLPIPGNRTCKSLDIDTHWCTCLPGQLIQVSPKGQAFTAKYLLTRINQMIFEYPECHKLSIKNILEVTGMRNNFERGTTYRVRMQTSPGDGVFEGTIIRERNMWAVSGTVSRLNAYRNQSMCVEDPITKMYCYCIK